METIKNFVKDHKKEILVVSSGVLIYSIGFKHGFRSAERGMTYIFEEAARTLPVKF